MYLVATAARRLEVSIYSRFEKIQAYATIPKGFMGNAGCLQLIEFHGV